MDAQVFKRVASVLYSGGRAEWGPGQWGFRCINVATLNDAVDLMNNGTCDIVMGGLEQDEVATVQGAGKSGVGGGNGQLQRAGGRVQWLYQHEEGQGGGRPVQPGTLTSTQMLLRLTDVNHVCGSTCSP